MKLITTPEQLLREICEVMQVDIEKIKSPSKKVEYVTVRNYVSYVGSVYYRFSASNLGRSMGGRDHSTALNQIKNIEGYIALADVKTLMDLSLIAKHLELDESTDKLMEQMEKMYDAAIEEIKNLRLKVKSQSIEIEVLTNKVSSLLPKNIFGETIY